MLFGEQCEKPQEEMASRCCTERLEECRTAVLTGMAGHSMGLEVALLGDAETKIELR